MMCGMCGVVWCAYGMCVACRCVPGCNMCVAYMCGVYVMCCVCGI